MSTKLGDFGKTEPTPEPTLSPRLTLLLGIDERRSLQAVAAEMNERGAKTPRGDDISEHFLAVTLLRWAIHKVVSGQVQIETEQTVSRVTIGEP